jgi:hypothetical protein
MAIMLSKLYDALRAANVPDDKAREAATEVAEFRANIAEIKSDIRLLKWIATVNSAGILAMIGMLWQVLLRLPH